MKNILTLILVLNFGVHLIAQEPSIREVDSLYKEDQFYAGVTYNLIGRQPKGLMQNGFSLGFHLGFVKDMPINKERNLAIGVGLGYSANSFNQNMLITKDGDNNFNYNIISDSRTFTKSKFSEHLVELPIEFRWRTSTPTEYKFWRIYSGFKLGYVFANTTKFRGDLGNYKYTNIKDFNEFQYGATFTVGYNTWNFYLYYALNPIFSDQAKLDGEKLDMNAIKIGLMFYIL